MKRLRDCAWAALVLSVWGLRQSGALKRGSPQSPGGSEGATKAAAAAPAAPATHAPPAPGEALYQQLCAACHDHPKDRIPPRDQLAKRTPEEVVTALSRGSMRVQAGGLNLNELNSLATYLTGRAPADNATMPPEKNLCRSRAAAARLDLLRGAVERLGSRPRQLALPAEAGAHRRRPAAPETQMGVRLSGLVRLRPANRRAGSRLRHQRFRAGLFPGREHGLRLLDLRRERPFANRDVAWRSVPESDSPSAARQQVVFFGDDTATVYALNAATGKLLWQQRLDEHLSARISGAPVFYRDSSLRARVVARRAGGGHARLSVLHVPGQRRRH